MAIDEINPSALKDLVDERSIRDLAARYSAAVARRDEAAWAATWADDAVWDIGIAKPSGREAIVSTWRELMGQFRFVTQLLQQGTVSVDGNEATGTWPVIEIGWPAEGPGTLTLGQYADRYRREAAGWLFSERAFRIAYMGPPDLSGHVLGVPDPR